MTKLQRLQIGNNDCTGLELYNCPELTDLSTIGSHFTSLDLSGCPSLVTVSLAGYSEYETWTGMGLDCSYNELKSVAFYAALGFNGVGNQIEEITTSDYMMSFVGTEYFLFESWGSCDALNYLPPTYQFFYEYPRFTVL